MTIQDFVGWLDPFRVISARERTRHMQAFRSALEELDGEMDVAARTLSRRERAVVDLARRPVEWSGAIDADGFVGAFESSRHEPSDVRTLWLVALVKANQGERFGVENELRRWEARGSIGHIEEDLFLHVMFQEAYHSRFLDEVCRTCGLALAPHRPSWALRAMLRLVDVLPERIRWAPILSGEVVGTVVFQRLIEHCSLFEVEPESSGCACCSGGSGSTRSST